MHGSFWVVYNSLRLVLVYQVTKMSHDCHSISNNWQLDCLFNSLLRLTIKGTSKLTSTGSYVRVIHQWFPSQRASNAEIICNSSRHHDTFICSTSQDLCTLFMLCSVLLWFGTANFTHILQGYFTDTGAFIQLPQCQGSNPEAASTEMGYIPSNL